MMYYLLSIGLLTIIFWALYKFRIVTVCPICAATVITWAVGLLAIYLNASWANPIIIAILMGASVGALADKYGNRLGLFWKSAMVILGLPSIYFLVKESVYQGLGLVTLLIILTIFSHRKQTPILRNQKDLFKECC